MVKPEFKDWACSYSGCDCGDIKSQIWLCGIEWGFSKEYGDSSEQYELKKKDYYTKELPELIAKGHCEAFNEKYFTDDRLRYPYMRNAAKLLTALKGDDCTDSEKQRDWVIKENIFQVNLYPIAFPNEADALWEEYNMASITGIASKKIYRTWCLLNRLPWIAGQVDDQKPKVFIGTGVCYLTDFIVCCGGNRIVNDIHSEKIVGDPSNIIGSTRTLFWAKINEKTTLAVIPFFSGRYGLNSNALLQKFGKRIAEVAGF